MGDFLEMAEISNIFFWTIIYFAKIIKMSIKLRKLCNYIFISISRVPMLYKCVHILRVSVFSNFIKMAISGGQKQKI